jgi:hypothetical protein
MAPSDQMRQSFLWKADRSRCHGQLLEATLVVV